jgi:hypothetical protein
VVPHLCYTIKYFEDILYFPMSARRKNNPISPDSTFFKAAAKTTRYEPPSALSLIFSLRKKFSRQRFVSVFTHRQSFLGYDVMCIGNM